VPCYFLAPCYKRKHTSHAYQQAASHASTDSAWRHPVWLSHSSLGFQRPVGRRSYRLTPQATIECGLWFIISHCLRELSHTVKSCNTWRVVKRFTNVPRMFRSGTWAFCARMEVFCGCFVNQLDAFCGNNRTVVFWRKWESWRLECWRSEYSTRVSVVEEDTFHSTSGALSILANVNSRARSLYAIARPSVVCL